jgi:hypothetical protein
MSPITKFARVIQNLPGDVDELGTTTGLVTTSGEVVVLSSLPLPQDGNHLAGFSEFFHLSDAWEADSRVSYEDWLWDVYTFGIPDDPAQSLNNAPGNEAERLCLPALVSDVLHSTEVTDA